MADQTLTLTLPGSTSIELELRACDIAGERHISYSLIDTTASILIAYDYNRQAAQLAIFLFTGDRAVLSVARGLHISLHPHDAQRAAAFLGCRIANLSEAPAPAHAEAA
ncbi:MAG: hypothetical protein RR101_14580 [Burkholderiaceae bacterium]